MNNKVLFSLRSGQQMLTLTVALACSLSFAAVPPSMRLKPGQQRPALYAPGSNGTNQPFTFADPQRTRKAPKTVAEAGPHHRVWRAQGVETDRSSDIIEISSGLHYRSGTNWLRSVPSFEVNSEGNAFVATRIQHPVRLSASLLDPAGAVTVMTPGGVPLRSTPLAIALFDSASGRMQVIGLVTNSEPVLLESNRVMYAKAFSGVCADIVFSVERGRLDQDIVFSGKLALADYAAMYGFPTNSGALRLQVITEFFGVPQPERSSAPFSSKLTVLYEPDAPNPT